MLKIVTPKSAPSQSAEAAKRVPNRLRLAAANVAELLERFKPGYAEKVAKQKLAELFQLQHEVREIATGRVFKVFDASLTTALLIDAKETTRMVTWYSSAGQLLTYVPEQWELVSVPAKIEAVDNIERSMAAA